VTPRRLAQGDGALVLIVDDSRVVVDNLQRILEHAGFQTAAASDCTTARTLSAHLSPDAILLDLHLPDGSGMELLSHLRATLPDAVIIVLTGHGSIRTAVEATRLGATDFWTKPFEPHELLLSLRRSLEAQRLAQEVHALRRQDGASPVVTQRDGDADAPSGYPRSPAARRTMKLVQQAADHDGIVLLLGESGVGKDYVARWIHRHSRRADAPFFSLNSAALPATLAETELFGHEPGAFTGSRGRKRGLLELARSGSLLINEVGELELPLQAKLLTFLDTREFLRLGGERPVRVDARLIFATNRDLQRAMDEGRFREDLYWRIHVFPITIPPLRERREDIPYLATTIAAEVAKAMGRPPSVDIHPTALADLTSYDWPGNIRELRSVLERALILSGGSRIDARHLSLRARQRPTPRPHSARPRVHDPPPAQRDLAPAHPARAEPGSATERPWSYTATWRPGESLHALTARVARAVIEEALRGARTRQEAAAWLGLSRHALAYQMKTLGIAWPPADTARAPRRPRGGRAEPGRQEPIGASPTGPTVIRRAAGPPRSR